MQAFRSWKDAGSAVAASVRVFLADLGDGLLAVSHNSLALIGLAVLGAAVVLGGRADVRASLEEQMLGWLQTRQEQRQVVDVNGDELTDEPLAVERATAADPSRLSRQQAAVAQWISRRYRVAPEPVSRLVQEAWTVGQRTKLEPTLILAIMAIESGFNPFAQSAVGAQGLMQVMTQVHDDKYVPFGGNHAAFDPVTNLRVGVEVLKECISRAGSLEGGLKYYVGAANLTDDGGYATKVMAEQKYLAQIAKGQNVPTTVRLPATTPGTASTDEPVPAAHSAPSTASSGSAERRLAMR
ncbi:MAG: hypothetical protein RLY71_705 [Pseudomonadota bacterium]|jgi:hypothetical protein